LDVKARPAPSDPAELFHFDNWRPPIKAFLYLTDVTEQSAPFVYAPGTHRPSAWRRRYDIEFDTHHRSGRYGHFFPHEIQHLRANSKAHIEERFVTGPAGTLIFADFRGLHRATPLATDRRLMLNNCFGLMNEPVGAAPAMDA